MKRVLAVSGGVDSMVLLDIFLRKFEKDSFVVATFDHGTRESSKLDAEFVKKVAGEAGIEVFRGEGELGEGVSEEEARRARYAFLRKVAFKNRGEIFTAHHLDDLIETTAINFIRGTGFRGLSGLSGLGIRRPFIDGFFPEIYDKKDILKYAGENSIRFRQDPTNESDDYLRNRVRKKVRALPREQKLEIFSLWRRQREIVREIDEIFEEILPEDLCFSREIFRENERDVSLEILRAGLGRAGISTTRPQREEFLDAILNYENGKKFNLPGDRLVKIGRNGFRL
ncbi:tRNA lysidine(34) synthetase TilS [Candidatus Saccharibacteria bacterium]|nr:tRNA lysidine(34) synthetase TilS [Candidatus Saccharibacteria bacterium]